MIKLPRKRSRRKKISSEFQYIYDFLSHPLEGLEVNVVHHPDPSIIGKFHVISETQNMLLVEGNQQPKMLPKSSEGRFQFIINSKNVTFSGDHLHGSAKDRSKRRYKDWDR